jgi:hypothetical protein
MTPEEFKALPEAQRHACRDLAACDAEVSGIEAFTPLNPRALIRQIAELDLLRTLKAAALSQGATQEGADLVRRYLK